MRRFGIWLSCLGLVIGPALADTAIVGNYSNLSQVVPAAATNIISKLPNGGYYKRIVVIDTALQAGTATTTTVWCAWGTVAGNAAVFGSNGFPLNPGFDDSGFGVNQNGMNCIQPSGTHYIRIETY